MRRFYWCVLLLALLMTALPTWVQAQAPIYRPFKASPGFVGWIEDEFVIVFRATAMEGLSVARDADGKLQVNLPELQRTIDLAGADALHPEFPTAEPQAEGSRYPDLSGYYLVHLAAGMNLDRAVGLFEADPSVEHVEKIGIHTMDATPNDPYYQNPPPSFPYEQWDMWGMHGIDADLAWNIETGDEDVVVGILDTGVRYFHTDIGGPSAQWGPSAPYSGGNVWINPGEIPANGVDDDGDGKIDDTVGWDFVASASSCNSSLGEDCNTADNNPDDFNGHGTHLAGTVAAITNNARSVAGIAGGFSDGTTSGLGNGVKVLPCRIGWDGGGDSHLGYVNMSYAAQAMNYVATLVDHGVNVAAVNCSWGSSNSGGLSAAVDALLARGVMVVHAAGNSGSSVADFLGNKAGVMNVAATDSSGVGASWSNYGSWVDVAAPGVDIINTFRNPDDSDPTHHYVAVMSGTSMSAPHICGIAALLESCDPALTGTEKFNLIVGNTTPYSDPRNLGSGIANAYLALQAAGCTAPCTITADFTGTPTSGEAPLDVQFTDLSTGAEGWLWNFGDGETSTDQNPLHEYENSDTFTVTLIVTNYCGADTLTRADYIGVTPAPCVITADFTGTPTSGEAPLDVQFTDSSTGAEGWFWDFGDGETSADQNPLHEYENSDTFTVTLIVTNYCGADTLTRADYIGVTPAPCVITADFTGTPTSGEAPLDVQFTDASTGAEGWFWDFGDGETSADQNPLHEYENSDTFTVTLIVTNSCGADTLVRTDYIGVTPGPCVITADFTGAPTSGEAPLDVQFTDASTGAEGWFWDFGDGETSADQNPLHEYENSDTFTVTLIVTNSCGADTLVRTDYIGVTPPVTGIGDSPSIAGGATWAYPNPFNPGTSIYFRVREPGDVRIIVFDAAGRAVRTLVAGAYPAGVHRVDFDAHDDGGRQLASGVYFYRFVAPGASVARKIILVK